MNKNLIAIFEASNVDANDFQTLKFDYMNDSLEGVSAKEANEKFRSLSYAVLGLDMDKTPSKRDIHRAMNKNGQEFFEVWEDVIDLKVDTGFHESEFFNEFVDLRNIAAGDSQEFWTDDKVLLTVTKTAGSHHDVTIQRLGEGSVYTVPTSTYTIAVGDAVELFLLGRKDLNDLTDAIAKAFVRKVQADIYTAVMSAGNQVPATAQFNKTMAISAATKNTFDQLIEDVETAAQAPVVIMGTKMALKKLNAYADVDWRSEVQKQQVNELGRLGSYEGTALIEIPQRFADNDVANKLIDSKKLLIIPQTGDKFVKFIDKGETEITENTAKGDRVDNTAFVQYEREMGAGVQLSNYIGTVTITD